MRWPMTWARAAVEAKMTEIDMVRAEIDHAQLHLSEWMESKAVKIPLALHPAAAKIEPQPLGVVLVIGAWNYPLQLILAPLVASIAAGNVTVLKPSELAPATSRGAGPADPASSWTTAPAPSSRAAPRPAKVLLEQHFDHIFYTGGEQVGKIVARAAAEHLTPVTLELGGKSPAVVMDGSSARRRPPAGLREVHECRARPAWRPTTCWPWGMRRGTWKSSWPRPSPGSTARTRWPAATTDAS